MKALAIAGTLLAVGALTSSPMSAGATGVGAAVYEGTTGTLSPGVPLLGGTGTFSFTAICIVGVSASFPPPAVAIGGPGQVCITASGSYVNTVCGTGTADGTGTLSEAGLVGSATYSSSFHIQFVAGFGVITGSATGPGGTGPLVGTANLIPTQGNCVTPVSQFTVAGVLLTAAA